MENKTKDREEIYEDDFIVHVRNNESWVRSKLINLFLGHPAIISELFSNSVLPDEKMSQIQLIYLAQ